MSTLVNAVIEVVIGGSVIINTGAFSERRIALVMETDTAIIPIGEAMVIYKATAKNVSKLEIKPNDASFTTWVNVPLATDIDIDITNTLPYDALVRITRVTTDNTSTIYIFTKVIQ